LFSVSGSRRLVFYRDSRREGGPLHAPADTPYTPGILYEYQKKGVVKFAIRK